MLQQFRARGALIAAVLALTALAGCREDPNAVRDYEPGVYKGKKDQEISDATREALRERTKLQSF